MMFKCSKCPDRDPCILSSEKLPTLCPNNLVSYVQRHAEWVQIEGVFLSEVPA